MGTHLITGAASGIGKATAERLRGSGHSVIGVDLHNAEIKVDLSTDAGRDEMVALVNRRVDRLDGVLAAAGIAHPDPLTVRVNYFGVVATLEGLRPLLEKSENARAVAICSTAALLPNDRPTIEACLAMDEEAAVAAQAKVPENAYMTSKHALGLWLRRAAVSSEWAGKAIMLNAVAPGVVHTPLTVPVLADKDLLETVRQTHPMAVERYAQPEEIAELIAYLLTFEGGYLVGQVIYIDGGVEANTRPDLV